MSKEYRCTPEQLPRLLARHMKELEKRAALAVPRTARDAVRIVRNRAPKAFGDLRESVHAEENKTVVDAPHAGAVEIGSPPHKPDLEKLIRWVRLRGFQGLRNIRSVKHGHSTGRQAKAVKYLLRREVQAGPGGKFSPIDAPRKVAEAIAREIEKHGTKPHWFVRESLPEVAAILDRHMKRAFRK